VTSTSPPLTRLRAGWYALADQAGPSGRDVIVVDLRNVTFIDAAGLGLLVGVLNRQRLHGGTVRLREIPPAVLRLLQLTGLLEVFPDADQSGIGSSTPGVTGWAR
jgi:anti-sigma B factor antagonist